MSMYDNIHAHAYGGRTVYTYTQIHTRFMYVCVLICIRVHDAYAGRTFGAHVCSISVQVKTYVYIHKSIHT